MGRFAGLALAIASLATMLVPTAQGAVGYEPDASQPSHALDGVPRGLAVDQASQKLYVAISSTNPNLGTPGEIDRFDSNLAANGVFAKEAGFYTGVAVNPLTQDFYGLQVELRTSFGAFGTNRLDRFSSAGVAMGAFGVSYAHAVPPIATDSAGRIFYPNPEAHAVQVFSPAGVLQEEIVCAACPGGSLGVPVSVAIGAGDVLYVADLNPDRALKLTKSGGGAYAYASTLQTGRRAAAVGVDPSTGDVLVGDLPSEKNYHIVAYNSAGVQFDDFGAGLFPDPDPAFGAAGAYQMAVNATTHALYVGQVDKFLVFDKATIDPPSVTTKPATAVGQLGATLNATVNTNGHAALDCEFEYTDDDDFQVNGFANATDLACPNLPNGYAGTAINKTVSGLLPGTIYRFRAIVTSNAGSTAGLTQTFEALPEIPPTVTTQSPQGVGQSVATLRGSVNPEGGTVSDCHFELGTSAAYGSSVPCSPMPGPVATGVAVSANVSGLSPGTTHHYRLVVSTNAGTSQGDDVDFATTGPLEPDPVSPPESSGTPAPPPPPTPPVTSPPLSRCKTGFRRERLGGRSLCVKICRKGFRRKQSRGRITCVRRHPARRRGSR